MTSHGVTSGDVTSGDVTSRGVTSGDVISSDVMSHGVTSGDMISGDVTSHGVTSGDVISGDVMSRDMTSCDVTSRDIILIYWEWDYLYSHFIIAEDLHQAYGETKQTSSLWNERQTSRYWQDHCTERTASDSSKSQARLAYCNQRINECWPLACSEENVEKCLILMTLLTRARIMMNRKTQPPKTMCATGIIQVHTSVLFWCIPIHAGMYRYMLACTDTCWCVDN